MKQQQMSCRDMELLCRQRAVFDFEHSWKWLAEAERWEHLAQKLGTPGTEGDSVALSRDWSNGNGTKHHQRRFAR
jgi:hypothetical protein